MLGLSKQKGGLSWHSRVLERAGRAAMGLNFLCIGAMRSGTSWLHMNLLEHPDIWLPPVKELHYLDHLAERNRGLPIVLQDHASRRRAWRYVRDQAERAWAFRPPDRVGWAMRYFLRPPSAAWYASLFPSGAKAAGECTPAYSVMSEEALQLLQNLSPNLRIVYLLRNPVHRDWSHAAKLLRNRRGGPSIDAAPDRSVRRALRVAARSGKSDYLGTLRRWQRHFPPEQMLVGFFDELERNPHALLARILQFLGVDAARCGSSESVETRFAAGSYSGIPERFLAYLSARHYERIAEMHACFDNPHTREWLDQAARDRLAAQG